jgi:hypothetical protein
MSGLGDDLACWLEEAGFEGPLDDPWAHVELPSAALTPAQLAHLEQSTHWLASDDDLEAGGAAGTPFGPSGSDG